MLLRCIVFGGEWRRCWRAPPLLARPAACGERVDGGCSPFASTDALVQQRPDGYVQCAVVDDPGEWMGVARSALKQGGHVGIGCMLGAHAAGRGGRPPMLPTPGPMRERLHHYCACAASPTIICSSVRPSSSC